LPLLLLLVVLITTINGLRWSWWRQWLLVLLSKARLGDSKDTDTATTAVAYVQRRRKLMIDHYFA
jgi:hypothetical protein